MNRSNIYKNMGNYQELVKQFQIASEQTVNSDPYKMNKEEYDFRENLFLEEFKELKDALVDEDRVEQLDALCDMKYINDGTANMIGRIQRDSKYEESFGKLFHLNVTGLLESIDVLNIEAVDHINARIYALVEALGFRLENFKTALQRVHYSNMSKFTDDMKTAEETKKHYADQGIDVNIKPVDKKFAIYRKGDGKVLKSVKYYRVYLKDLV